MRLVELEVRRKPSTVIQGSRVIDVPERAAAICREILAGRVAESLIVLHLDIRHRVIGWEEVARGELNVVRAALGSIFRGALLTGAAGILLAHNHPSNDFAPSIDDHRLTAAVKQAGELLGVRVLDHLIITDGDDFYSFKAAEARTP